MPRITEIIDIAIKDNPLSFIIEKFILKPRRMTANSNKFFETNFGALSSLEKKIGIFFWQQGDQNFIDRFGPDGISKIIKSISNKAIKFQSGYIYDYAFIMLIGLSALITYLILN